MCFMQYRYQKTVKQAIAFEGIGVHSGLPCTMTLRPADVHHGIVFSLQGRRIPAHWASVSGTRNATTLSGPNGDHLSLVEHILAACYGLGITNLSIESDNEELPILDGSALPFVTALASVGLTTQSAETSWMVIKNTYTLHENDKLIRISPLSLGISVTVPVGGTVHKHTFHPEYDDFAKDIAPARTFAQLKDVHRLREADLIKGGGLNNALVLDESQPINPGGLRLSNECARHKILDFMGDFATIGHRLFGSVEAISPSHALNHKLITQLMQRPSLFDICTFSQLPKTGSFARTLP